MASPVCSRRRRCLIFRRRRVIRGTGPAVRIPATHGKASPLFWHDKCEYELTAKPVRPGRQSPERARHWRNRRENVRNLACFRAGYRRGGRHPGCGTGRPLGHPRGTATADWQERQGAAWRLLPAGNRKSLDLQGKRSLLRHIPHPGDHQDPAIPGVAYFLLNGFPQQDYWLREDAKGSVLQYDPSQAMEKLWWAFNSPPGQQYSTDLPGTCCRVAMVASRGAAYKGPLGTFDSALQISYPGVFQVGIMQETFLPGIGLALRTQAAGGPSYGSWELIYARAGGVTVDSAIHRMD